MEVVCVPLSDTATAIGAAATLSRQMTMLRMSVGVLAAPK